MGLNRSEDEDYGRHDEEDHGEAQNGRQAAVGGSVGCSLSQTRNSNTPFPTEARVVRQTSSILLLMDEMPLWS